MTVKHVQIDTAVNKFKSAQIVIPACFFRCNGKDDFVVKRDFRSHLLRKISLTFNGYTEAVVIYYLIQSVIDFK
ncbi:MAG: hypothetical protein JXA66_01665 [Oligoflexia bacterium]|nr:hypothetical protein [Oligoflexia bacterium]